MIISPDHVIISPDHVIISPDHVIINPGHVIPRTLYCQSQIFLVVMIFVAAFFFYWPCPATRAVIGGCGQYCPWRYMGGCV